MRRNLGNAIWREEEPNCPPGFAAPEIPDGWVTPGPARRGCVTAPDAARHQLARELHDQAVQQLLGISYRL
ncbi:MAG: hypothetical protein HC884_19980 [Chloroflexaceae bacterium]|nr:hypothetical protein [Chloroflexaceae bacterium]